ncbi:MAG TPA: EamA family transporter [Stellaceae bacterium]|nr:EamA family transporter [Stellaceae bacterium]
MLLSYGALAAAILVGVAGQLLLKQGAVRSADQLAQFLDPFTISGLAVYGLAAALYIVAIKRLPVSVAFPSVALSYVLVAIAAHFLWQEPLGLAQFAGIVLIGGGILLLHLAV